MPAPASQPAVRIDVGVLLALSPHGEEEEMLRFARRIVEDAKETLEGVTGVEWAFHEEDATLLRSDDAHRPADFLDEASLRMVEGPYDVLLVVTDVSLASRTNRVVEGLASPVGRFVILSTRKLRLSPREEPLRPLESETVRWNAAALLLHLLGHVLGLEHEPRASGTVMAPFAFEEGRRAVPPFSPSARGRIRRLARRVPERDHEDRGTLSELWFHLTSALRHPGLVLSPLLRNRALFLPLSLPRLATAAVAPAIILVFTEEIWAAGIHMTDTTAWVFAIASMLFATVYLTTSQNLFFPHKEKRFHTEHLAVVNVSVFLTILLAVLGLFLMLGLLMLGIELFVFPPELMQLWSALEQPRVGLGEQVRIAVLISTIGVLTGALAGGLESRDVIRHLALFRSEP
jgi:predicted Zn-dependent protease